MLFEKYHTLGNDYIVIDPQKTKFLLNEDNIKLVCDRNRGIGSDGLVYGPIMENGRISLRLFNSDGSETDISGNGLCIFAKYLIDLKYIKKEDFAVFTKCGKIDFKIMNKEAPQIKINIGSFSFSSKDIGVEGTVRNVINEALQVGERTYNVTCVFLGNPHCIIPLEEVTKEVITKIGPIIENKIMFSNRINVQCIRVIDRSNIDIEIWERGSGYTLASGTGACAAACAAYTLGLVDNKVNVLMRGGEIKVEVSNDKNISMITSAERVCNGNFLRKFA